MKKFGIIVIKCEQAIADLNKHKYKEKLMTRNEAIELYGKVETAVDFFIKTGMLKVEEEKTVEQKLSDAFYKFGMASYDKDGLIKTLDAAGLKIVEK